MADMCIYHLQIRGPVAEADIEAFSPPGLRLERLGDANTLVTIRTDQAGLVGLLRYLHGLGFVFLSLDCVFVERAESLHGSA